MASEVLRIDSDFTYFHPDQKDFLGVYMEEGEVELLMDACRFHLQAGKCQWFSLRTYQEVRIVTGETQSNKGVLICCNEPTLSPLRHDPKMEEVLIAWEQEGKGPEAISPEQRALMSQLTAPLLPEPLCRIYQELKISELLIWYLKASVEDAGKEESTSIANTYQESTLKPEELERVYAVRDLIRSNLHKSFTLVGLARAVGTNDATLKKHFKQALGTTVFGYLRACRMERAQELLLDQKHSVAEVAQELGYKHLSHFSSAFRQYYGYAPSKLLEEV